VTALSATKGSASILALAISGTTSLGWGRNILRVFERRGETVTYAFEDFRLNTDRRRLLAAPSGDPIQVSPKVLDTLIYLVERRGELVDKDAFDEGDGPGSSTRRTTSTAISRRCGVTRKGRAHDLRADVGDNQRFSATFQTAALRRPAREGGDRSWLRRATR
jgi:hypothetical protein